MTTPETTTPQGDTDGAAEPDTPPDQLLTDAPPETDGATDEKADAEGDGEKTTTTDQDPPPDETTVTEEPPAEPQAPEAYDLNAPDGVEKAQLERFEANARKANLTNAQAQALVDTLTASALEATTERAERLTAEFDAHPEVGKDREATRELVNRALLKVLPEEDVRERMANDMAADGLGDYLPLVLVLSRVGKMMAEDSPALTTGSTPPDTRTTAEIMYDHPDNKLAAQE
jgi:hypothetical protein